MSPNIVVGLPVDSSPETLEKPAVTEIYFIRVGLPVLFRLS